MAHIQIQSDISMPFMLWSNYHFWGMLTFSVTEGVTVTFRRAGDGGPRVWILLFPFFFFLLRRDMTALLTEQWGYPQD